MKEQEPLQDTEESSRSSYLTLNTGLTGFVLVGVCLACYSAFRYFAYNLPEELQRPYPMYQSDIDLGDLFISTRFESGSLRAAK